MQVAGSLVLPSRATDLQAPHNFRSALEMKLDILRSAEQCWQLDFSKFASVHAHCTPSDSSHSESSDFDNQNIGIILLSLVFGIGWASGLVHL